MWQKTRNGIRNLFRKLQKSAVAQLLLEIPLMQKFAYKIKLSLPDTQTRSIPVYPPEELARRQQIKNQFGCNASEKQTDYAELFVRHEGYISSKWGHYCYIYQELFARFLTGGKPITLLEIGVQNGGSLELWARFLPEGSQIYGIDVAANCLNLKFADNIRVYHGNAANPNFWQKELSETTFDVIIDDGSHLCDEVIATFNLLFDKKLNPGGIYLVEDLHTSYAWAYKGGFCAKNSSIEHFKKVIDAINAEHYKKPLFMGKKLFDQMRALSRQIRRISFYDSICAVEKYYQERENAFEIFLTGYKAEIYIDNHFEERKIENNLKKMAKLKQYFEPE